MVERLEGLMVEDVKCPTSNHDEQPDIGPNTGQGGRMVEDVKCPMSYIDEQPDVGPCAGLGTEGPTVEDDAHVMVHDSQGKSGMVEDNKDEEQVETEERKSVGGTANLQGAMTGPLTGHGKDVGATVPLRMIKDVLGVPRGMVAPTNRRRVRAKRGKCSKKQGTIWEGFSKMTVPKEKSVGFSTVEGTRLRKRKGEDLMVEDSKRLLLSRKQPSQMIDDDDETRGFATLRTFSPIIWGAKSGCGRDPRGGQTKIPGNGLDLCSLAPMKEKLAGDWTTEDDRNT